MSTKPDDTVWVVGKVVQALRGKHLQGKILIRADSGFCRVELMRLCETHGVFYLLDLAGNAVLKRLCRGVIRSVKAMMEFNRDKGSTGERLFKELTYRQRLLNGGRPFSVASILVGPREIAWPRRWS